MGCVISAVLELSLLLLFGKEAVPPPFLYVQEELLDLVTPSCGPVVSGATALFLCTRSGAQAGNTLFNTCRSSAKYSSSPYLVFDF